MTKNPKAVRFNDGNVYAYSDIWDRAIAAGECVALFGKEAETALHEYRRAELLDIVKVGSTLTAVCTHYNRNSGSARYKVFIPAVSPEGRTYIRNITRQVAALVGFRLSKDDEIVMGGCGYSKSFQIGYSLGNVLWPNGTPEAHGTRNGEPDHCGGYAIAVDGA
jgi:hypothetical protein